MVLAQSLLHGHFVLHQLTESLLASRSNVLRVSPTCLGFILNNVVSQAYVRSTSVYLSSDTPQVCLQTLVMKNSSGPKVA